MAAATARPGGPLVHHGKAADYMAEYVDYFLKIGLQDPTFLDTSPSLLGAAVVAAARTAFGLSPGWPGKLQVTGRGAGWTIPPPESHRLL